MHRALSRMAFLGAAARFLTGHRADGRPGRARRAAWRAGGSLTAVTLVAGWFAAPVLTGKLLTGCFIVSLILCGGLAARWVLSFRHRRRWLRPLHLAACDIAGIDRRRPPHQWLEVPRDRSWARLALPAGFPAEDKDKQRLITIASAKIGMEAAEPSWRLAGPKPQLMLLPSAAPPPGRVRYDDVAEAVEQARADEFITGIGKKAAVVKASLTGDSPHFAINMGTGGGKSALAGFWLMQALRRGGIAMVLDNKWHSIPWLFKDAEGEYDQLPNVAYLSSPAAMHAGMMWLGEELTRRNRVTQRGVTASGRLRGDVGPPIFIVAEELNFATPDLKTYWAGVREPDEPKKSPALTALGKVAFAGRAVKMHLIMIGQMLTAEVTGSKDNSVKENIGVKALARYGASGWNTMVGRDVPMPPVPATLGRIQLVTASGVRETQTPVPDGVLYRELVLAGEVMPCPAGMPGARAVPVSAMASLPTGGSDVPVVSETRPVLGQPGSRVTLSEAVALGVVSCSLTALRKASQRDGFPERRSLRGVAGEWDAVELATWEAERR